MDRPSIDVFLFSSPRSGSTMARLTLNKLPNVVSPPETHYFVFKKDMGKVNWEEASARRKIAKAWVNYHSISIWPVDLPKLEQNIAAKARSYGDMLSLTVDAYLNEVEQVKRENVVVVEKSPPHIFHVQDIRDEFPSAKLVGFVRDPRDVIGSLKNCYWSTSNVLVNAKVWRSGIRSIPTSDVLVIKYEEFVQNPEKQLEIICNYIGVEYASEIVRSKTVDQVESDNVTSASSLEKISPKKIGSWKYRLSKVDRDLEIIQRICRKEMADLGYEILPRKSKAHLRYWLLYLDGLILRLFYK